MVCLNLLVAPAARQVSRQCVTRVVPGRVVPQILPALEERDGAVFLLIPSRAGLVIRDEWVVTGGIRGEGGGVVSVTWSHVQWAADVQWVTLRAGLG